MKKVILLMLSIIINLTLVAQQFTAEFLIENKFKDRPQKSYTLKTDKVVMSPEQQKAAKDSLLRRLEASLANLQDPELNIEPFYDKLWGDGFTRQLVSEITRLIRFLKGDKTVEGLRYDYVPSPIELNNNLLNSSISELPKPEQAKEFNYPMLEYRLIVADPYRNWLWDYYRKTAQADEPHKIEMDMAYRVGWRKLEAFYSKSVTYTEELRELAKKIVDCKDSSSPAVKKLNEIRRFKNEMDNYKDKTIEQLLKRNKFFRKWLWYSNGLISMNPLIYTNPFRAYPAGEKNTLLNAQDKEILSKAAEDGALKNITETKRVMNRVLLPPLDGDINKEQFLLHYNAATGYKSSTTPLRQLSDKQAITYLIHNVPERTTYTISHEDKDLQVISEPARQLEQGLGLFNDLFTDLEGSTDALRRLTTLFNPADFPHFEIISATAKKGSNSGMISSEAIAKLNQDFEKSSFTEKKLAELITNKPEEAKKIDYIVIEKQKVIITKNIETDKRNIIKASRVKDPNILCVKCNEIASYIIDSFLVRDQCYLFSYAADDDPNQAKTLESANLMLARWDCFLTEVVECLRSVSLLAEELDKKAREWKPWVGITNRNLPPLLQDAGIKKEPLLSTVVIVPELPDPPKTRNFSLTEVTPKGSGTETTSKVVIRHSIKHAGLIYIDVSAGISYTPKDYSIGQKGANGLPTRVDGEQVQGIGGLHIYPWGIFKLDNSLRFNPKHRSSVFLGVGIPKALDHFYVAYSYDIVPGFKAMAGWHFFKDTRFRVVNNQIANQAQGLESAGLFFSFNIQPATFIAALSLF